MLLALHSGRKVKNISNDYSYLVSIYPCTLGTNDANGSLTGILYRYISDKTELILIKIAS